MLISSFHTKKGIIMGIRYIVKLTSSERKELSALISKVRVSAKKSLRAMILLKADISDVEESWGDDKISEAYNITPKTIYRLRKRFVEEGLEACLERKPYPKTRRKILEGAEEARLISICCSKPPEGRARWTLKLLADKLVSLEIVEEVSRETIRRTLKKTNLNLG